MIYVTASNIAGRGVFTAAPFKKGEEVELAPYLMMERKNVKGLLESYYYETDNPDYVLIMLGYGSLYNHSNSPNLTHFYSDQGHYMSFVALRDIEEGEELTLDYGEEFETFIQKYKEADQFT